MQRLTITLTEAIAVRVNAAVEEGQYGLVSELMRQALLDWELAEARRSAELKALREEVAVGLDQIAAGEARPFDADRIVAMGKKLARKSS